MSSFQQVIGDTLAQVNIVRNAFGHAPLTDLPDARPGDSKDCLYFRALKDCGVKNVSVGTMEFESERQARLVSELWGTESNGRSVSSPRGVSRVISEFDNHRTPHYDV